MARRALLAAGALLLASACGFPEGLRRQAHYDRLRERNLYERAEAYYRAGRYEEAADAFRDLARRARASSFRRDEIAFRYADCLLALDQFAEASVAYARAAVLHPASTRAPEGWIRAAVIRERLGDRRGALDAYRALVEAHPASPEADEARARLSVLEPALAAPPAGGAPATLARRESNATSYRHETRERFWDVLWPGPPLHPSLVEPSDTPARPPEAP